MRSVRRPAVLVPLLLTAAFAASGCGGGDPSDPDGRGTTAGGSTTSPPDRSGELAQACTALLNDRDQPVFKAGMDASLAVLLASTPRDAEDPGEPKRSGWRNALSTARDALAAERDRLASASDDPDWKAVLKTVDDRVATYEARIAIAKSGTWPPTTDPRAGGPAPVDQAALTRLGIADRDCARVADEPGPDPRHHRFVTAAASACTAIVDRRRTSGFDAAGKTVLGIVLDVRKKQRVAITDDRRSALRTLRDEWRRTASDLRAVPVDDVPDAAAWRAALGLATDRADGYGQRLASVESGDRDRIAEVFDIRSFSRVMGAPGWEFEALGLERRDCGRMGA